MAQSSSSSSTHTGRVKWFNTRKGFGFLVDVETSEDVFVYFQDLVVPENTFRNLYEGEYVEFTVDTDDQGRTVARNVTGVHQGPLQCTTPRNQAPPRQTRPRQPQTQGRAGHGRGRGRGAGSARGGRGGGGRGRGQQRDANNFASRVEAGAAQVAEPSED